MKSSIRTIAIALALAPAAAFAQTSSQPQNGYPASKTHYPSNVQRAQSPDDMQGGASMNSDSGYGGVTGSATQSGSSSQMMTPRHNWRPLYEHH